MDYIQAVLLNMDFIGAFTPQIDGLMRINAELMFSDIKYVAHNTTSTQFSIVLFTGYPGTFSLTPDAVSATDNWKAGDGLGKCNGTQIGRDAADRLSQIANWNIKYGFIQSYYGTYWIISLVTLPVLL